MMKITIKKLSMVTTLLLIVLSVKAQTLYVGTNYHPHDDNDLGKIKKDIMLMKAAGFKAVRMDHLAWDSYEPSEGKIERIPNNGNTPLIY